MAGGVLGRAMSVYSGRVSARNARLLVLPSLLLWSGLCSGLVACRSEVARAPSVVPAPPSPKQGAQASSEAGPSNGAVEVFDLRERAPSPSPVVAGAPAWPQDPSPTVDVVIRVGGMDEQLKQDAEVVVRIGAVSRRILTRQTGSTRMGVFCPDETSNATSPDEYLPKGEIAPFAMKGSEPQWVSWISFSVGGVTTLHVVRPSADTLRVQVSERGDGPCDDVPDVCFPTATLAVVPIPPGAKTRGRVVDATGDGDVPFTLCP